MMTDKGLDKFGAVCIDGTDAGFYITPSPTEENKNDWVVFFQGGGWCFNEQDCLGRSNTFLGSSKNWPNTYEANGPMSMDCSNNPDFCNYNKVFIRYCDGNSFSGNREEPLVVNEKPLYFRGKKIKEAVFMTLKEKYNLAEANNFI